jgi:hypothetical protein
MAQSSKATLASAVPALVESKNFAELLNRARAYELLAAEEDALLTHVPLYGVQLLCNLILNELYVPLMDIFDWLVGWLVCQMIAVAIGRRASIECDNTAIPF